MYTANKEGWGMFRRGTGGKVVAVTRIERVTRGL